MLELHRVRPLILGACALLLAACQSQAPLQPGETRAEERAKVADLNTQLGIEYMRDGSNELALHKLQKRSAPASPWVLIAGFS